MIRDTSHYLPAWWEPWDKLSFLERLNEHWHCSTATTVNRWKLLLSTVIWLQISPILYTKLSTPKTFHLMVEMMANRGWKYSIRGSSHLVWTLPPRLWHLSKPERPLPKLPFYLLWPLSLAGHKIREAHLAAILLCALTLGAFGFLPAFTAVSFTPKNPLGLLEPGLPLSLGRLHFSFLKCCWFLFSSFLIRPRVMWLFFFFSYWKFFYKQPRVELG